MNTPNTSAAAPIDPPSADEPRSHERPGRRCGPRSCGAHARPGGPHTGAFLSTSWARRRAPVNIEDTPAAYVLSLFASGLDKSAIHVSTQADLLRLRYEPAQSEDRGQRFTWNERADGGFDRSFALNGKVQIDAISATYQGGVLTVVLPKLLSGGA